MIETLCAMIDGLHAAVALLDIAGLVVVRLFAEWP